jgi:hypothetical protein
MESTEVVRRVNPSNLERAHTVGAISALAQRGTKTNTPVVETLADIIDQTRSMTTALVVTGSVDGGGSSQQNKRSLHHFRNWLIYCTDEI